MIINNETWRPMVRKRWVVRVKHGYLVLKNPTAWWSAKSGFVYKRTVLATGHGVLHRLDRPNGKCPLELAAWEEMEKSYHWRLP